MSDADVTVQLEQLLYRRHRTSSGNAGGTHVFGLHVRNGAGFATTEFDAVAMHTWQSKRHLLDIFEIKASRGDLLRELKDPDKSAPALALADRFWLVIPAGIDKGLDIPPEWGILAASSGLAQLRTQRQAKRLHDRGPEPVLTRSFVVALFHAESTIPGKNKRWSNKSLTMFEQLTPLEAWWEDMLGHDIEHSHDESELDELMLELEA